MTESITTENEQWRLRVVPDAAAMSAAAADIVAADLARKPNLVFAVPTGNTPLGLFDELAARVARGEIDFSKAELFCLDEHLGVSASDPNSLTNWLFRSLIDRTGIPAAQVHALPATTGDPAAAAAAYEQELTASGGLDLAVLGMGPNGHVAYNEPGSTRDSRTRVIDLAPESIAQAAAYWHDTLPVAQQAITMGVGTLLEARRIALIVSGAAKAEMVRRALEEPMSADVPTSWLRLAGPRLDVILDDAAAGRLSRLSRP